MRKSLVLLSKNDLSAKLNIIAVMHENDLLNLCAAHH